MKTESTNVVVEYKVYTLSMTIIKRNITYCTNRRIINIFSPYSLTFIGKISSIKLTLRVPLLDPVDGGVGYKISFITYIRMSVRM